jgi:membrane protease YdiL (CAAX protease family)
MPVFQASTLLLLALFLVALSGGLVPVFAPLLESGRLLPPQRHRAVPWTGLEICFALLVPQVLAAVIAALLVNSGALDSIYGTDFQALVQHGPHGLRQVALDRLSLWTGALTLPLEIAAIIIFFRWFSMTRPYHLGLASSHAGRDARAGVVVWLIATPLVFAVNVMVGLVYDLLVGGDPEEHPLTRVVSGQAPTVDWVLMVFLAVVAAPVSEELVFRGVLQRWFGQRAWGGDAAMLGALAVALVSRSTDLEDALRQGDSGAILYELSPALFVLALVPGYLWIDRFAGLLFPQAKRSDLSGMPPPAPTQGDEITSWPAPRLGEPPSFLERYRARVGLPYGPTSHNVARAIYGTSALFAVFHASAWPTPIPLFVLALVLGWLAYRTQSLIGPMVLHGLFNSVTVVYLLLTSILPLSD